MKNVKNKLVALALIACGIISTIVTNDATALIFLSLIGIGLFLETENVIW